ncbi:MAG TPA: 50S ribosomal protein L31 [Candidatus Riflebacteria bacterium]|jgi:large subunit ribosomal protein L31|nr:MAG: 50S ribosomal protein L31 [Candidatus Riflebacteria bacterium HGW-Riflebacteria-1]HAE40590.1 50S ribosomal protein L31 [Candidatus Riflebacteria bacterium]
MKQNIHPKTNLINVTCACGNAFQTISTAAEMKVEVCSECHPFFTGTQRFVDTTGRVERFKAKLETQKKVAEAAAATKKAAKPAKAQAESKPE